MEVIVRKEHIAKIRTAAALLGRDGASQNLPAQFTAKDSSLIAVVSKETIQVKSRSLPNEVEVKEEGRLFLGKQVLDSIVAFVETLNENDFLVLKSDGVSVDLYDKSQKRLARYAATARERDVEFFTLGGETAYADVSAPEFYEALDYVSHVSTRSDQFSRGYLIDSTGDELTLVCTDTHRICACSVDATRFDSFRIFVDRSVVDATSFLRKEDKIRIKSDGRSLYIVSNSYQVRTTTLCQGFPNYRRLFEEKRTRETELNVDEVRDALKKIGTLADKENFRVTFDLDKSGLVVGLRNKTFGEIAIPVAAKFGYVESTILFYYDYVGKYFNSIKDKTIRMTFNPDSNVLFEGEKTKCLVLPLILV